jgi:hypothetical protein
MYIRLSDDAYPISESQIRAAYPNTSFSVPFSPPDGYANVFPAPAIYDARTHSAREGAPVLTDKGHYEQTWIVEPLPAETVTAIKAAAQVVAWGQIKAHRDRLKENGVNVGGNWFHTDTFSRTQHLGLVMMGAGIPAGLMWKTMDNTYVEMTPTLANAIFQGIATLDTTTHSVAEAHRQQMLLADNPAAYDFSANWPATHA